MNEEMSFKLDEKPGKQPYYIWSTPTKHYYRHCATLKVFPEAINLFLNECTSEELRTLLDGNHFLRVNLCDDNTTCRVLAAGLDMAGLIDRKYEEHMRSLPGDQLPCELFFGPYWHLLGLNKLMINKRRIELYTVITKATFRSEITKYKVPIVDVLVNEDSIGFVGLTLHARDAYASETDEEKIRENEKAENIVINRRK